MKAVLYIVVLLAYISCCSKKVASSGSTPVKKDTVSFVTTIDTALLTKDGIYLNGYVVNIGYGEAKKLHGKRVNISGAVTLTKAVNNKPDGEMKQGRGGYEAHTKP